MCSQYWSSIVYRRCGYLCSEYDVFKFIIYASIYEQLEYLGSSDKLLLLFRVEVFIISILIMLFHNLSLFSPSPYYPAISILILLITQIPTSFFIIPYPLLIPIP